MESGNVNVVEELLERIRDLEKRMNKLEGNELPLTGLETDAAGSVSYQGEVTLGDATYSYAWERPTTHLTEGAWDETMKNLGATAHPVRGRILQHLLNHPATVAELVEAGVVSSTGTGYHHLTTLQSAGWIYKDSHGLHSIKAKRVVALLTLILAMEEA
ncbi:helix-turn-helix transcriptional regulator [uncultured Corynebacterium sp.]|uniref:ArsR/SmtB family transcription factor n=1 Tax=uncultured Corynebacterium sp. TaxID=159447 RepID=UPI0025F99D88|nr:winged helix-turn-helix domain-containing protein [uncultured Corynebacterium sp.]